MSGGFCAFDSEVIGDEISEKCLGFGDRPSRIIAAVIVIAESSKQTPECTVVNAGQALILKPSRDVIVCPIAEFFDRDFPIEITLNSFLN